MRTSRIAPALPNQVPALLTRLEEFPPRVSEVRVVFHHHVDLPAAPFGHWCRRIELDRDVRARAQWCACAAAASTRGVDTGAEPVPLEADRVGVDLRLDSAALHFCHRALGRLGVGLAWPGARH